MYFQKWLFRLIVWGGIFCVMGPGSSIHNQYDALFHVGGIVFLSVGFIGILLSSRRIPPKKVIYKSRLKQVREQMKKR